MTLPSILLFLTTTAAGSLISISSSSWLYVWMGLELNLLSFIPLMAMQSSLQETEAAVKYFLNQAIGSGLLLSSALVISSSKMMFYNNFLMSTLFIASLILKTGCAPFHWWLPPVMSSLSWANCIILATWQKLAPLMLILSTQTNIHPVVFMLLASLNAMVGGLGGLNQTHLRPMLAYSSIGHMGWMLAIIPVSTKIMLLYFSIYVIITSAIMMTMLIYTQLSPSLSRAIMFMNPLMFTCLTIMLLSLGGLPPMLGFIPKWMAFITLSHNLWLTPLFILILGSLINLFYYLSMAFNFYLSPLNHKPKNNSPSKHYQMITLLTMTSTISSLLFIV